MLQHLYRQLTAAVEHLYRQLTAAVDSTTLLVALCTWLVVFLTYRLFLRPLHFSPLRVMPSCKFVPLVGQCWTVLLELSVDFYLREARKLGPVFRHFWMFGAERVLVAEPDAIRHILVTNKANYVKPAFLIRLPIFPQKGLLVVSGKEHTKQRKILNPAFKRENLKGMVKTFQERTKVLLQCWQKTLEGRTGGNGSVEIPVHQDMGRLTLDIIGECAFSYEFNSIQEPDNLVNQSVTKLFQGEGASLLLALSTLPLVGDILFRRLEIANRLDLCYTIVDEVIKERKRLLSCTEQALSEDEDNIPNDLLSLVMEARDKDTGEGLPDDVIRDEVMTFMIAGQETTSTGLSWLLLELSRHPEVQDRLRAEVRAVLPGDDTPITWDLLDQIPYLMWVVKETLRLHPPLSILTKQALQDDRLGQYPLPAGTVVLISPFVLHRLSHYWEVPDTFNPERFASDPGRNPYTFLPFFAGPHTCIGSKFALAEMRAVTAVLVQQFQFRPVPGVVYMNRQAITTTPDPPLCLRVSKAPV